MLTNGMIILRDSPFPIRTQKKITVIFLNKTYESQGSGSEWLLTLDPAQAGGPFTMKIISDDGEKIIEDIYAGDVWLCSGQSNMELMMERLRDDYTDEWESFKNSAADSALDYSLIRQFKVFQSWDFSAPRQENPAGNWIKASSQTLNEFSAAAWFFAKNMYEKYRVPIGLVNTAWGGTPIESWMSKEALKDFPEKIAEAQKFADQNYRGQIAAKNADEIQKWEENIKNADEGLRENWHQPQTDISEWNEITLPGNFSGAGLSDFRGVLWLAKDFNVDFPADNINCFNIWLGTITDADTVFINGVFAGSTGYRYPPRKYSIPSGIIKKGKNRIVLRVVCNSGEGCVTPDKPFKIFADNVCVEFSGTWKYKTGAAVSDSRPKEFFFQWQPIGPFNAMIYPVLKYPLKGVIWYQGESNGSNPHEYARLFRSMILDWRRLAANKELPFLFVQLPIWNEPSDNDENASWALVRQAQTAALCLPATGIAAALELGEWNDLHPVNKKDIGYRLFLAAEKVLFNADNSSPGPVIIEQKTEKKEQKIFLYFDNCAGGLIKKNENIIFVSIISDNGQERLPANIENKDCISVDLSSIKNPKKILYASADNPRDRQLFNNAGLPALPFNIDISCFYTN